MPELVPLSDFPVYFIAAVPVGDAVEQAVLLEWHPPEVMPLLPQDVMPLAACVTSLPQRTGVYVCRATLFVPPALAAQNGRLMREHLTTCQWELHVEESRALWLPNGVRRADPANLMQDIPFSTILPAHR